MEENLFEEEAPEQDHARPPSGARPKPKWAAGVLTILCLLTVVSILLLYRASRKSAEPRPGPVSVAEERGGTNSSFRQEISPPIDNPPPPILTTAQTGQKGISTPQAGPQEAAAPPAVSAVKAKTDAMPAALPTRPSQPGPLELVRQARYRQAAARFHAAYVPAAEHYSIKLEVDCLPESLEAAFREGAFSKNMFILPKKLDGKECFVVLWGVYRSRADALQGLSGVPVFFQNQASKAEVVVLKQYL